MASGSASMAAWAVSRGGASAQRRRQRLLHRSSSSMSVPWDGTRRIRVTGWPSGVATLTMRQLGMAKTSGFSRP